MRSNGIALPDNIAAQMTAAEHLTTLRLSVAAQVLPQLAMIDLNNALQQATSERDKNGGDVDQPLHLKINQQQAAAMALSYADALLIASGAVRQG